MRYYPGDIVSRDTAGVIQCGGCRLWLVFEVGIGESIPDSIECDCEYRTEVVHFDSDDISSEPLLSHGLHRS